MCMLSSGRLRQIRLLMYERSSLYAVNDEEAKQKDKSADVLDTKIVVVVKSRMVEIVEARVVEYVNIKMEGDAYDANMVVAVNA